MNKTPQRMCISCRTMHDKARLLRIVRTPDGEVCIDNTGKKSGRGAYVCENPACRTKCVKVLKKHLNAEIPASVTEFLTSSIPTTK